MGWIDQRLDAYRSDVSGIDETDLAVASGNEPSRRLPRERSWWSKSG